MEIDQNLLTEVAESVLRGDIASSEATEAMRERDRVFSENDFMRKFIEEGLAQRPQVQSFSSLMIGALQFGFAVGIAYAKRKPQNA